MILMKQHERIIKGVNLLLGSTALTNPEAKKKDHPSLYRTSQEFQCSTPKDNNNVIIFVPREQLFFLFIKETTTDKPSVALCHQQVYFQVL